MRKFILGLIAGIIIGVGLYWMLTHKVYDEAFYFPDGFEGCAYVVYNIQGASQLTIEDGAIQYYFDEDGLLLTVSPQGFGWEGRERSGFHDTRYYYVNEESGKTEEIPESETGPASVGSYSENGRIQITGKSIPVGDEAEACGEKYDELDERVDEELGVS